MERQGGTDTARQFDLVLGEYVDRFIDEQIASGRYESASEVIMAGLRLVEKEEGELTWLREQIAIGEAQYRAGNFREVNDEFWKELDREVDERVRPGDRPSPHVCP